MLVNKQARLHLYRGRILAFLNVGFLCGGFACLAYGLRITRILLETREAAFMAGVLLMLAAISGLFAAAMARRQTRDLTETIRSATRDGEMRYVETPDLELAPLISSVNEMVSFAERSVSEAALKTKELEIELKVANVQRQHAEAILYSISDAVVVTDPFDEIRLANESAARIFDFDLEKAVRTPVEQVLRDPALVSLIREMRQSDSTSGRRIVEHRLKTGASEQIYKVTLSCVANPLEEHEAGSPAGVVAVFHDMTREKEVAEMKNDFVSNVSHELRTPLASIKAYVEMLIDGEANDEKTQGEFYEVIQNEANRLGRLIDNILNISRIESGLVRVEKKPQSLMVILKEAVEVISPQ
ncbi:MAG: PAS domain-containing protein, partial [Phycisphaerae bacterium]|nr:PAS domain-containing protein [Phycisphaerae bacterium]